MADSWPSITGGSCSVCVVEGHGVFVGAVLPWVGHHSLSWLGKPSSHFSLYLSWECVSYWISHQMFILFLNFRELVVDTEKIKTEDFPGSSVVDSGLPMQAVWVWSLVGELRSYMACCLVVVQSLSCVWLIVTPWTAARQASLSFTISWSLLELMFSKLVMPSNHLIHCYSIVNNHRQSIYLNCISFWYNFSLFKLIIVLFAWFKKTFIWLHWDFIWLTRSLLPHSNF